MEWRQPEHLSVAVAFEDEEVTENTKTKIVLASPEGTKKDLVPQSFRQSFQFTWSPNGKQLLMASNRDLKVLDIEVNRAWNIQGAGAQDDRGYWSPDSG